MSCLDPTILMLNQEAAKAPLPAEQEVSGSMCGTLNH